MPTAGAAVERGRAGGERFQGTIQDPRAARPDHGLRVLEPRRADGESWVEEQAAPEDDAAVDARAEDGERGVPAQRRQEVVESERQEVPVLRRAAQGRAAIGLKFCRFGARERDGERF